MASKILVDELAPYTHATDVTLTTGKKIAGAITQFKATGGATGNIIETDGAGNLSFIAPTVGLSNGTQFRLTADFTGVVSPITANWAIVAESGGHGLLGPPVVETSGTFSYPAGGTGLGYWLVEFKTMSQGSVSNHTTMDISVTTNNSTYNKAAEGKAAPTYGYINPICSFIHKVSDITLDKVQFNVTEATTTVTTHGNALFNETTLTFIKIGVL
jgi:hypothetical protein